MDLYTQHPPISNTEPTTVWKCRRPSVYCRAAQTHLALNFSLFWSWFLTFLWTLPVQKDSALTQKQILSLLTPLLHHWKHSPRWGPRLVATATRLQERGAAQWFQFTSVLLSFCHHMRLSLHSKASQVCSQKALSPRCMWNRVVQQSFIHLLQLEWNIGRRPAHLA